MSQYVYTAKFNLTNALANQNDPKFNHELAILTNLRESITENFFERKMVVDVNVAMVTTQTGNLTLITPAPLTTTQLQSMTKFVGDEIQMDKAIMEFGEHVPTANGMNQTELIWNQQNEFKLVS